MNTLVVTGQIPFRVDPARAPTFVVWAMKDPESGNLDRVQMVKGYYRDGYPREMVYNVTWSDNRVPDATTSGVIGVS